MTTDDDDNNNNISDTDYEIKIYSVPYAYERRTGGAVRDKNNRPEGPEVCRCDAGRTKIALSPVRPTAAVDRVAMTSVGSTRLLGTQ